MLLLCTVLGVAAIIVLLFFEHKKALKQVAELQAQRDKREVENAILSRQIEVVSDASRKPVADRLQSGTF